MVRDPPEHLKNIMSGWRDNMSRWRDDMSGWRDNMSGWRDNMLLDALRQSGSNISNSSAYWLGAYQKSNKYKTFMKSGSTTEVPMAPIRTVKDLLDAALPPERWPDVAEKTTLVQLMDKLKEGRPAVLSLLKELGVDKLGERQKLANALAKAERVGVARIGRNGTAVPVCVGARASRRVDQRQAQSAPPKRTRKSLAHARGLGPSIVVLRGEQHA